MLQATFKRIRCPEYRARADLSSKFLSTLSQELIYGTLQPN